jgi:outer membrane protein assembly factor BamE (lipoprotein component of BamABCDE complex)
MAALVNGVTTKEEVRALLGEPSGRAMFPALQPGEERYIYQFVDAAHGERLVKRLELVFDDDDVLSDFGFVSDLSPAAPLRSRSDRQSPF